jgi:hypothetical protein
MTKREQLSQMWVTSCDANHSKSLIEFANDDADIVRLSQYGEDIPPEDERICFIGPVNDAWNYVQRKLITQHIGVRFSETGKIIFYRREK